MSLGILLENQLGTLCFWLFCIKTQMHGSSQIHNCWVHTRDWRFPGGSDGKESICNVGDLDSIPGLGSYPGEGNGYLFQYSCLENPMDRETGGLMGSQRVGHDSHFHFHQELTPPTIPPTATGVIFSSVQFSCSVVSDSLRPHELQHARPPCPSPTPGHHPDSRPSSQWCHPAISSSAYSWAQTVKGQNAYIPPLNFLHLCTVR